MKSAADPLEQAIHRYKYRKAIGWRVIFGRLLLGHLQQHPDRFAGADLILAAPTWTGPPDHRYPHTEAVVDAAAAEDTLGRWPFDAGEPRAITVTGPRPPSAGGGYAHKQQVAEQLARMLRVADPARVAGKRILVYDDVLTTGLTLHAIATVLRQAGAAEVNAIVLARQPWRA